MEGAISDNIVQLLTTLYQEGRVPCADALPLHITFDPGAVQVRLTGEGSSAYHVVFPETKFVEMIQWSGVAPTETLIRVWLSTIYFDTHAYPWACRTGLSGPTSHEHSRAAR